MQTNKDLKLKFHLTGEVNIPSNMDFTYLDLIDSVVTMIGTSPDIRHNVVLSDVDRTTLIKNEQDLEIYILNLLTNNEFGMAMNQS